MGSSVHVCIMIHLSYLATEFIGSAVVPAGVDVDLGGWPHSSSRPSEERFSLTGSLLRRMSSRSTEEVGVVGGVAGEMQTHIASTS